MTPCKPCKNKPERNGYGRESRDGKRYASHRLAYADAYGPIPAGLHVCHRCDNPSCVNPEHLFLGTDTDNQADKKAKGRACRGETRPLARLTAQAVAEIRQSSRSGRQLAKEYGVDRTTVDRARRVETWSHV